MRRRRDDRPVVVLGLDLSLTGTGMVAVPADWGGDWRRVLRERVGVELAGASERDRVERLRTIAQAVLSFARRAGVTTGVVEEYAFSRKTSRAHAIGELGGHVKAMLLETRDLVLEPVPSSELRKLLLGRLPRTDPKGACRAALAHYAGLPRGWSPDEVDAFVAANFGLSALRGARAYIGIAA